MMLSQINEVLESMLKNSLIIHKEKTKEINV